MWLYTVTMLWRFSPTMQLPIPWPRVDLHCQRGGRQGAVSRPDAGPTAFIRRGAFLRQAGPAAEGPGPERHPLHGSTTARSAKERCGRAGRSPKGHTGECAWPIAERHTSGIRYCPKRHTTGGNTSAGLDAKGPAPNRLTGAKPTVGHGPVGLAGARCAAK